MAKQIRIKYKGEEYILEFNRKVVEMMEAQGFVASTALDTPMTSIPKLVHGAFRMHHPQITNEKIYEIWEHMPKEDLLGKLVELYKDPIENLMADPEEDSEGNAEWTVNW